MNRILVLFIAFCLSALSYGQNAETLRKANAGDAEAQYDIAVTYLDGMYGAEKNDEKYVYWLKKSANNGYAKAQYDLGELYCYGEHGVYKDKSEYLRWAKKAAYNGYEPACYSLGLHFKEIDKQEAIYWLKKGMDLWWKENKEEKKEPAKMSELQMKIKEKIASFNTNKGKRSQKKEKRKQQQEKVQRK